MKMLIEYIVCAVYLMVDFLIIAMTMFCTFYFHMFSCSLNFNIS